MPQPHSLCVTAQQWVWGGRCQGKDAAGGLRGHLALGQSLGGAAAPTGGVCSSSISEVAQISDSGHSTTAHAATHAESHMGLTCSEEQFHNGSGGEAGVWWKLGAGTGCEEQRRLAPEAASLRVPTQAVHQTSVYGLRKLRAHRGPTCFSTPALWCGDREKHSLKGKRTSSEPTLRASAPVAWGQMPPPIQQ